MADPAWEDAKIRAACRDADPELFFHPHDERGAFRTARDKAAKAVCRRCPIRRQCLRHALATRQEYGVWGGWTEGQRQRWHAGRRMSRRGVA